MVVQAKITATVSSARRVNITNAFLGNQIPDSTGITITLYGFVNPLYNTQQTNSFIVMTMNIDPVTGSFYFID